MSDLKDDAAQEGAQPAGDSTQVQGLTDAAPAKKDESLAERVEQWFGEHFRDSVVSRDTEVYNHVRAAVDALKKKLSD